MGLTRGQIAVLPTLAEVLYEPPTIAGTKACGNCALWSEDRRCALFDPDQVVYKWDACGYHVPGEPAKRRIRLKMAPYVEPRYSGLGVYPRGTRCGTCPLFVADADGDEGDCLGVRHPKRIEYARVHGWACCSRYAGW
jgi:hypothetical protein